MSRFTITMNKKTVKAGTYVIIIRDRSAIHNFRLTGPGVNKATGLAKVLKREDGASILRPQIAIGKAWGAIGMGESSRSLGERLKERPAFLGALSTMSEGKVVPVAGGVLIMSGNEIIGSVGVSGGTADEDEACAIEGIKAAGLEFKV